MRKAFTLIELMVVISIIAILSTIALMGFRQAQNSARDTKKIATINGAQAALERYYGDVGTYPGNLTSGTFTTYMPSLGTGDSSLTFCGSPVATPCVSYSGGATYTITFYKSGGGTVVYQNPQ